MRADRIKGVRMHALTEALEHPARGPRLDAGTRAKDTILIPDPEQCAEIAKIADLQDLKVTLYTYDPSTFITLTPGIETALTFGK